jgi:heptosyltransferase-2
VKFLIIRFSSIGDIVLTTPVIRCLRKKFPEAEIHFLTKQNFRAIVDNNPYINKVHVLGDSFDIMMHELITEEYDYVIDLHHNLRTARVKRALKTAKTFSFNKLNVQKYIYVNTKINVMPRKHIVDRYLETVRSLGVENDGMGLDYFIPEKEVVQNKDIPTSHLYGYIGVVIGAAHATKRLPVEQLKDLCASLNYPVILLGGPEDNVNALEIAKADPVKIYNACGKFSINESADLVKRSKLVITHDTGLMHIAAAFKKPLISIWGNTVPDFGMTPYYGDQFKQHYDVVEIHGLWCRPCSKIGYDKCPRGHFKCMRNIAVNDIVKLAEVHLRSQ